MTQGNDARIAELLGVIEPRLLEYIPRTVRELRIASPAYCLFLWYQDLSAMEFAPDLGVGTVELRDACFSGEHDDKLGDPPDWCVWRPQQTISGPFPGFPVPGGPCDVVMAEANECYSLMSEIEGEEEILLLPFRSMMHRIARHFNSIDWSGILPTTDDFIVFATDYIGYWFRQDLVASVGSEKVSMLQNKNVIPSWGDKS